MEGERLRGNLHTFRLSEVTLGDSGPQSLIELRIENGGRCSCGLIVGKDVLLECLTTARDVSIADPSKPSECARESKQSKESQEINWRLLTCCHCVL